MKSRQIIAMALLTLIFGGSMIVSATPSTIIWIPSVDFQGYKSFHLGIDNYAYDFKSGKPGSGTAFPTDLGLTVGVLPDSIIKAEVGVDYFTPQLSPFLLNAKVGVPEGALTDWAPAIAVGGFGFGFLKNVTDFNIVYGIVGKTFPVLGRIEVGYFSGNKKLLVDLSTGSADNSGVLLSWDRQITEISENLWLAIDYQDSKSSFGALSYGFAWSFSKNVSVIFARDVFNADLPSTFTMQLDINI
ncbi:MAG: hypothetical protein ABR936_16060 [Bacteroidota bacterium]|jgi:hypothetical protein